MLVTVQKVAGTPDVDTAVYTKVRAVILSGQRDYYSKLGHTVYFLNLRGTHA